MQKVIGLDIGSYSIKAVEIVNTFKSYEIVKFYETVVPVLPGVPLDAIVPTCMEQLFQENNVEADRIVTAMPGQFISSRILPFNFSDPRKIEASLMIQLEDCVPFNMDDMVVDHQILGTMRNRTMVLAVMTRRAFLRNFIDLLSRIDIDPKLVDIDSLAFYNLSSHLNLQSDSSYAMVDIGHEKTSVCIVRDGLLRMFRSINLGGRYMTDFLARDLECDYHQAQRIKHRVSRVFCHNDQGDDIGSEDREAAERMTLASSAIIKELGRTLYSFKSWDQEPLGKIYLSGGSAVIKNFPELLQEQLEVQVEPLRIDRTELKMSPEVVAKLDSVPQSLAIGLRAVSNVKKHSQVNLRRGEFAYSQNYESILKGGTLALKVIGFAVALLLVSFLAKYFFYNSQIESLQKEYARVYRSSFKKAKIKDKSFQEMQKQAVARIKGGIAEMQVGLSEYQQLQKGSYALQALLEISKAIPEDVLIDVVLYDFKTTGPGEGKLILKAETDNYDTHAKIVDLIKSISILKDVDESKSYEKPGTDGKKIEFTIEARYES